jgi:hypothetical protein
MSINAIRQYESMKSAILLNLNAINTLLQQAEQLTSIVDGLEENSDKKAELTQSIQGLNSSIKILIEQTDILFKQCIDFANSVNLVNA